MPNTARDHEDNLDLPLISQHESQLLDETFIGLSMILLLAVSLIGYLMYSLSFGLVMFAGLATVIGLFGWRAQKKLHASQLTTATLSHSVAAPRVTHRDTTGSDRAPS
ncbi:hypothetical protein [Shewanella sp. NIFS-20-20]|uniref:hypothetical protein n=1 Tax=Shewanella sp. NIFS-20-20 TaxID=2853806 RepID=UPI001C444FB5|nr:hypothetical protein [Shewanella sp. NIFS-20-20]MBV7316537.1 hypothetical protein [Shewanella sp. NIFS-20-20]